MPGKVLLSTRGHQQNMSSLAETWCHCHKCRVTLVLIVLDELSKVNYLLYKDMLTCR